MDLLNKRFFYRLSFLNNGYQEHWTKLFTIGFCVTIIQTFSFQYKGFFQLLLKFAAQKDCLQKFFMLLYLQNLNQIFQQAFNKKYK